MDEVRDLSPGDSNHATIVWIAAGGCDGCTMSVLGATSPRLEELLSGQLTQIPRIELVHPVLSVASGDEYLASLELAAGGRLDPFVLVVEGSLFDTSRAGEGSFSGLGAHLGQPIPVEDWVARLAPQATAVVALGTCATWGGIPAAEGNVTGAMGLGSFLGANFKSKTGLPIVNVPGCAASGDAFVETVSYILLDLGGLVPLALDEHGQPEWLFKETTPVVAVGEPPGEGREAVEAPCPVPARGWINRIGGCAAVGGGCIGCTRPDFPDGTLPLVTPH